MRRIQLGIEEDCFMVARFHYDDSTFRRLISDQLPSHEEKEVTSHIERCADCQAKLEAVSEADISWNDVRRFLNPQTMEATMSADSTAGPGQAAASTNEDTLEFLAPSEQPNSLGRFGRYEITEILGRGGMGVVMRGYDPALDRHSAIKVLAPELATNASARNRFAREAKSAAAVVHEHVVPIQTVDQERGLPYLVMPVVEGPSLEQRVVQSGPLAVVEILRIGTQIASGLAAAHTQGLVHRDVKPANILLENGVERVTITDFGLARAVDDASMTRSGVIAGTPQYMSPEQARGNDVDHRSDLFSLGSVLYFMCTGRSPFRAETTMGVLNRITNDTPRPIRKINADIPEWLCRIIAKLMSKRPDDRFESAGEVAEFLEECLAHVHRPTAVPLPASLVTQSTGSRFFSISRRSAGVIAMIATFGFGLLGMVLWQATTPPDITGRWTGGEWGEVKLVREQPGKYEGTYTRPTEDKPGSIQVKWSRIERRYNGTWREAKDRFGKISLRLVDGEIRGAWTTNNRSQINSGTPRLADFVWKRGDGDSVEETLDRNNPRSVAEAYCRHSLAGRFEEADKLTRDRAAKRRTSEMLPSALAVSWLDIVSHEVRHENGQSSALVFSDTVKLKKGMPDGTDPLTNPADRPLFADGVRLVVFLVKDEADGWVITDVDLDSEEGAEKRRQWFLGSTHGSDDRTPDSSDSIPAANVGSGDTASPDTNESRSAPRSVAAQTEMAEMLSDAIHQFNQQQRQDAIGRKQPLLTDDEVIASIRADGFSAAQEVLSEDEFDEFHAIAESRLVPANWMLEKRTRVTSEEGGVFTVWAVNLKLVRGDGTSFTHSIRDRTLKYEPPPGQNEADEPQAVAGWVPLADLVAEFNESTELAKSGQPPLTVEECIASLRRFLSQDHSPTHFSSAAIDAVATMADTRTAPRAATVLDQSGHYSQHIFDFQQCGIRFKFPVGEGGCALILRHRHLSSSPIERIHDDDIAWGPQAEDGLQVGIHLVPAGHNPIPGEKYLTTFFFRNQTSTSTVTLEWLIAFEIDARTRTGDKLDVTESRGGAFIGILPPRTELKGSIRAERPGVAFVVSTTNKEDIDASRLEPDGAFDQQSPIAVVHADPGQRIRLRFRVPNYSDPKGPQLVTGPIDLTVNDTLSDADPDGAGSQAITPTLESVPDPQIDNPSDTSASEQDDRQDLVVVDAADYGDTDSMMKLVELERNAKTSKLRLTYKKRASSVGSSMFIFWGLYEVAKARGTEYFVCLSSWSDPNGGSIFIAGFSNTKEVDIHKAFGEFYDRTGDQASPLKYWSVSEWEFLCRGVTWSPPNDDSEAKAEIAAVRLAVEKHDTPSRKHAVLTEAFVKSDSPHVKMCILEMAKFVEAPELEPFLLSVLQDATDVRDRILAVTVLAEHGSAASIEPLLDCAANDPEGEAGAGCMRCRTTARRDAYYALAEIGLRHPAEKDRIAAAVAALSVTTDDAHDPKAQALYILTQDPKLLEPFLDRLQNEDPEIRVLGVRALRPFKLSHAPEQLVELLADSNPNVQADAARLLGTIGDPKTIPVLIEVATATDRDRQLRCAAVRAIGSMRVKRAESVMRDLLTDEAVEVVAAIALFQITGERHPLLPEGFDDDDDGQAPTILPQSPRQAKGHSSSP